MNILIKHLTPENRQKLDKYLELLCRWNKAINLTGYNKKEMIIENLLPDSFYLSEFLQKIFMPASCSLRIYDLGAGAGLPGIPLRLCFNHGKYVLVEKMQKRAIFLANVLACLKLENTGLHMGSAEKFLETNPPANCIVSRAFMPWSKLLDFCKPYLANEGCLIIMANKKPQEIPSSWRIKDMLEYKIMEKTRWLWALMPK